MTAAESKFRSIKNNGWKTTVNCTQKLLPNIHYSHKNSDMFQSVLAILKEMYVCEMKLLIANWYGKI